MNETNTYKRLKNEPKNNFPEMIIVHHSGGTDLNPLEDTSNQTAQIIEEWHFSKGWDGLGYHYVIHKNGDVWLGRPEYRNGAHAVGYNTISIGICVIGNFDLTLPTKEQENAVAKLIQAVRGRYPIITQDKIYPHRKFANKTCYGKKLADNWANLLIPIIISPPNTDKIKIKQAIDILQSLL